MHSIWKRNFAKVRWEFDVPNHIKIPFKKRNIHHKYLPDQTLSLKNLSFRMHEIDEGIKFKIFVLTLNDELLETGTFTLGEFIFNYLNGVKKIWLVTETIIVLSGTGRSRRRLVSVGKDEFEYKIWRVTFLKFTPEQIESLKEEFLKSKS
jgi:hypothetical protein